MAVYVVNSYDIHDFKNIQGLRHESHLCEIWPKVLAMDTEAEALKENLKR